MPLTEKLEHGADLSSHCNTRTVRPSSSTAEVRPHHLEARSQLSRLVEPAVNALRCSWAAVRCSPPHGPKNRPSPADVCGKIDIRSQMTQRVDSPPAISRPSTSIHRCMLPASSALPIPAMNAPSITVRRLDMRSLKAPAKKLAVDAEKRIFCTVLV